MPQSQINLSSGQWFLDNADVLWQLIDVTSDAVLVIDTTQCILSVNKGAEKIFGYTAEEILGEPIDVLLPARFVTFHRKHIETFEHGDDPSRRMGQRREIFGLRKDGSEFPAEAGISKLKRADGVLFAVILRDVTERRQLELEARTKSNEVAVLSERNRLARELHDAVTQSLFSATIMADSLPALWELDREKGLRQLEDIRRLNRSALAEMRTLLLELRANELEGNKLGDLLKQLAEVFATRSGVEISVNVDERAPLPSDIKVAFYRIAQESLNNISKHSRARTASLQVSLLSKSAMMLIHDDGVGFDIKAVGGMHMGLRIMHERAQEVGAQIQVESLPGSTDVLVNWSRSES